MSMRVSTSLMFTQTSSALLDIQAQMQKSQQQIASGKRINSAADDPAASSAILNLKVAKETNEQYQKNADVAISRLEFQENVYDQVNNSLLRLRDLTIQANSDSYSGQDRSYISAEVQHIQEQLMSLSNTRDLNGEYLFSGNAVKTLPFVESPAGTFGYQGDDDERVLKIGSSRIVTVADSGKDVFMKVPSGNGVFEALPNSANTGSAMIYPGSVSGPYVRDDYLVRFPTPTTYEVVDGGGGGAVIQAGAYTPGGTLTFNGVSVKLDGAPDAGDNFTVSPSQNINMFSITEDIINALAIDTSTTAGQAHFHNELNRSFKNIDQAMEHIEVFSSSTGGRLNAVDSQKEVNDHIILQDELSIGRLGDLDMITAIANFQQQLTSFQAAQQAFVKGQSTTLFDFL